MDIASAAISGGMGLVSDIANQAFAQGNANKAVKNSKELTRYNKEQQIDLFNRTGYEAQVNQMENAGLNPALIYAKGGQGGSTNLATGDSIKPDTVPMRGMDIALQGAMMQAQIELAKSQANKNNVEAENAGGVNRELTIAQTKEALERANLPKAQIDEILTKMALNKANEIKTGAETEAIKTKTPLEADKLVSETKLNEERAIGQQIDNLWQGKLNRAQLNEVEARIVKMRADTRQKGEEININKERLKVETFAKELQAEYPTIGQITGKALNDLYDLFGVGDERDPNERRREVNPKQW